MRHAPGDDETADELQARERLEGGPMTVEESARHASPLGHLAHEPLTSTQDEEPVGRQRDERREPRAIHEATNSILLEPYPHRRGSGMVEREGAVEEVCVDHRREEGPLVDLENGRHRVER